MSDAEGDTVTLARKSYEHLLRSRDRALREAEWKDEMAEHARQWAHEQIDEQRRLVDRLNRVCYAAASLGVSIDAINAALDDSKEPAHVNGTDAANDGWGPHD